MSPLNSAALTVATSAAGSIANGKGITFKFVMGSMFYAVALIAVTAANSQIGEGIGTLVLVAAIMTSVPGIAKGIGLTK